MVCDYLILDPCLCYSVFRYLFCQYASGDEIFVTGCFAYITCNTIRICGLLFYVWYYAPCLCFMVPCVGYNIWCWHNLVMFSCKHCKKLIALYCIISILPLPILVEIHELFHELFYVLHEELLELVIEVLRYLSCEKKWNEPWHGISNNVALWQVYTQTSLCSLPLRLETPFFFSL